MTLDTFASLTAWNRRLHEGVTVSGLFPSEARILADHARLAGVKCIIEADAMGFFQVRPLDLTRPDGRPA